MIRTFKIYFPEIGPWIRDETVEVSAVEETELAPALRQILGRKLPLRTPRVDVDLAAGTVRLDGGEGGTGTIVMSWPVPAGPCGMGMGKDRT